MSAVVGGRVVGVERLQRVDELERLLDEVRHEAGVGLLAVPRALLAQRAGELVEAHVAGADRRGQAGARRRTSGGRARRRGRARSTSSR